MTIRNLGIIAHVDAGKTTLTEAILLETGRIHAAGRVIDGDTISDSDPIERARGITIKAAAVSCAWRDHRLNLIDTPGHVDFTIEVERSLRVLDGAVVVLDGVAGVEAQTESVWRRAVHHGVPRICFVNKLDRQGADLARCLRELQGRLGARPVAITLPRFDGDRLVGVVDVLETSEQVLEVCADEDPEILAAVVDGRPVGRAALRDALRRATLRGAAVPVICGAAYRHVGVPALLDAVIDYLPAPSDRAAQGDRLVALAFKVSFDDHGQMTYVRVYDGVLERGAQVTAARAGRTFRVGRLVELFADKRIEVDRLGPGAIGAWLAVPLTTGETLCDPSRVIALEPIALPEPVIRVAVEARTADDRERLGLALARTLAADPSLRLETDPDTGQTLLAGMGQLHLEITVQRLARDHGVAIDTGPPQVAYRTTLSGRARREVRHVRQTGGPGMFAVVTLEVGPAPRGAGALLEDRTRGGAVPRPLVEAALAGVREALSDGLLGGHPVVDVEVAVVDGQTHPRDSSELAFKIAGALAFRAAAADAAPLLLEPILSLEVGCDEATLGAVLGDLSRRRGRVLEVEAHGDARVVRAELPAADSFGYAAALSALTHGRGRFTLEPARYEPAPE